MHVIMLMQVFYSLTNIPEVPSDELFGQPTETEFNLLVQGAVLCVFQHHICQVLLFLVVIVQELYYVGMV